MAQTNSWLAPFSDEWEAFPDWQFGLPSVTQSAVIISNATSKVVTIDKQTAHKFPGSVTISNLIVSAQNGVTNTLMLNKVDDMELHVLNGLTLGNSPPVGESELISSKSTLVVDGLLGGELLDDGVMLITGGSLIATNCSIQVGTDTAIGVLTISKAVVLARDLTITSGGLSSGSVVVAGGTMTLSSFLTVGNGFFNSPGSLLLANDTVLVVTNGETDIGGLSESSGSMTVSDATFFAADVFLGGVRSVGTLEIGKGSRVTVGGQLGIGFGVQGSGSVFLDGGELDVTNGPTHIGVGLPSSANNLAVSGGLFLARDVSVGATNSGGTLSINGGTSILSSNLQVGVPISSATVLITAGHLFVTNAPIVVDSIGASNAQCIVSGGHLASQSIQLGVSDEGALIVNAGSVSASVGITLGDCNGTGVGNATVDGGQLTVTNSAGTGFIDVRNGVLTLSSGVLRVDKLVMTNTCGSFVHTGGTLIVGTVVGP
jgi:hypothetical protein